MMQLQYKPGDEHREDYRDAKRRLLVGTTERVVCRGLGGEFADFYERVMIIGDYDDNEVDIDIQTDLEQRRLQLMILATDERRYTHPEAVQPGFMLKDPEITRVFHSDALRPSDRRIIAEVTMGRAYFETEGLADMLSAQRFIELLRERYQEIVRECTIGPRQPRTDFDML